MQGFWNNFNDNDNKIISWDPKEGKNNVERGIEATKDASDVGTGGGRMLEGKVKMVQGKYLPITIRC